MIGQNNNRPANERRRRLHSGNDQVYQRTLKLFLVVIWTTSLDEVTDKTFFSGFTLSQSTPALHGVQKVTLLVTELPRNSTTAEGPRVIQEHWQCCHSIDHIRFPISVPLQLCIYLALLTIYYHLFPKFKEVT